MDAFLHHQNLNNWTNYPVMFISLDLVAPLVNFFISRSVSITHAQFLILWKKKTNKNWSLRSLLRFTLLLCRTTKNGFVQSIRISFQFSMVASSVVQLPWQSVWLVAHHLLHVVPEKLSLLRIISSQVHLHSQRTCVHLSPPVTDWGKYRFSQTASTIRCSNALPLFLFKQIIFFDFRSCFSCCGPCIALLNQHVAIYIYFFSSFHVFAFVL